MDATQELFCEIHLKSYKNIEDFLVHKAECEELLSENVCLFTQPGGKSCGESFSETSLLIIHYLQHHNKYACSRCFAEFDSFTELKGHHHNNNINLRLSK